MRYARKASISHPTTKKNHENCYAQHTNRATQRFATATTVALIHHAAHLGPTSAVRHHHCRELWLNTHPAQHDCPDTLEWHTPVPFCTELGPYGGTHRLASPYAGG